MPPDSDKKPLSVRIQTAFAQARFLTFSALMHVILVIIAGSAVIFQQVTPAPDFEAGSGDLVSTEMVDASPPEPEPQQPQMQPVNPQISAPSLAAITTANVSTTFSVNSVPVAAKIDGKAIGSDVGKAVGDKLAGMSAGAGRMGGRLRTAMIFGKKVEAAKLGVILDVSGSAHPHLAGAIKEIQKGFKDAVLILYPGCGLMDFDRKEAHDIRKYSSISKRDLEKAAGNFTTPTQLTKALKIEEFEKMTKRASVKENLYVSWFNEEDSSPKLIGQTKGAFDDLVKKGVDSIYWFADFADRVDPEVVKKLRSELERKKITLHVHNFAGKPINPLVTEMAEKLGGTVNTEKPK